MDFWLWLVIAWLVVDAAGFVWLWWSTEHAPKAPLRESPEPAWIPPLQQTQPRWTSEVMRRRTDP